ncbi:MAG: SRPBCC family protein [Methanobacterium sp.]|jgi:uncharacterized protein YndB with AHSA1/START domain
MSKVKFSAEPDKQMIAVTQIFDAPRELVWKIYTDPKLIPRWWGPRILETTIEKMDVKTGGSWRVIQRDLEGNDFIFHGVFHDVQSPERITRTMEWEGMPGHVLLETVTFEEFDGKTKAIDISIFQSIEDRDGMIKTGMEAGVTESYERSVELLKELQKE